MAWDSLVYMNICNYVLHGYEVNAAGTLLGGRSLNCRKINTSQNRKCSQGDLTFILQGPQVGFSKNTNSAYFK